MTNKNLTGTLTLNDLTVPVHHVFMGQQRITARIVGESRDRIFYARDGWVFTPDTVPYPAGTIMIVHPHNELEHVYYIRHKDGSWHYHDFSSGTMLYSKSATSDEEVFSHVQRGVWAILFQPGETEDE